MKKLTLLLLTFSTSFSFAQEPQKKYILTETELQSVLTHYREITIRENELLLFLDSKVVKSDTSTNKKEDKK